MDSMLSFAEREPRPSSKGGRPLRFGWHGDSGLGDHLLEAILTGRKTATACPSYDPKDGDEGEVLALVDKAGEVRGRIRITRIEHRSLGSFDAALAERLGAPLAELHRMLTFANSREIGPGEEMRVTYFELLR